MDHLRLIFRVHTLVKRLVNQAMLSALGISLSHGSALLHLAGTPEMSCRELALLLGCGASRISRLVQELERLRLVVSRRGRADRRVLHISITSKGATLASRVPAVLRDTELLTFTVLPDGDRQCLVTFLSRILVNANRFSASNG